MSSVGGQQPRQQLARPRQQLARPRQQLARPWQQLPPSVTDELAPLIVGITDEVMAAIHEDMPATARAGEAFQKALRADIEASYRQLLAEFGHREPEPDRSVYLHGGWAQMRAGRRLDELLAFYRISALVFWRRLTAAARRDEIPLETAALLGESIIAYVHELSGVAARGYADAQSVAERALHVRRDSLARLLVQPDPDEEVVAEAARAADWELPERVAAVVLARDLDEATLQGIPSVALSATIGATTCIVAHERDVAPLRERLTARTEPAPLAAIGPLVAPLHAGLSYERASMALELALAGAIPGNRVVEADEHRAALVLAGDHRLAVELSQDLLAPLATLKPATRARLTETLESWLAHPGRPQAIADDLHLHVQSARYRLDKLRALFGDRLDDPNGRFELAIALRARRLGAIRG